VSIGWAFCGPQAVVQKAYDWNLPSIDVA
jgi:hypothetical protein